MFSHWLKVLLIVMLAAALPLAAADGKNGYKRAWVRLGGDLTIGGMGDKIPTYSSLPLGVRNIPHHPDDPNWSMVIPNQAFTSTSQSVAIVRGSPVLVFGDVLLLQGGYFGPLSSLHSQDSSGPMYEVNQYGGTDRGYNTSLVTLRLHQKPATMPGFYGQAELKLHKYFWLMAGWAQTQSELFADRGYDRYDKYQSLDTVSVATISRDVRYGGFVIPFLTNVGKRPESGESQSHFGYQMSGEFFVGQERTLSTRLSPGLTGSIGTQPDNVVIGFGFHVRILGTIR